MGGSQVRGVPRPRRRRRGHLRPLHHLRLRRQRRGGRGAAAGGAALRRRRLPRTPSRRPTRPPSTPWSTISTRSTRATDRPWAAGDTLKNVLLVLKHPDGTREPLAIGAARRPRGRPASGSRASSSRSRSRRMDEADFRRHPALVKGYIGPGALGADERLGHPLPRRPARRRRHPLGHRRRRRRLARARPGGRSRLHPRRHDRGRRGARRRPLPGAARGRARDRSRHRDGPHLPARPQVRRRAGAAGPRRERQARHGHDGLLRHRAVARRGRHRREHPRRARSRAGRAKWPRPTSTSSPPARTRRSFAAAEQLAERAGRGRRHGALRRPAQGLARA